jgi:hypothetical protein
MANPNNNMNAYNQALIINRDLKKRIDKANEIVDALLTGDGRVYTDENCIRPNNTISDEHLQYLYALKEVLNPKLKEENK